MCWVSNLSPILNSLTRSHLNVKSSIVNINIIKTNHFSEIPVTNKPIKMTESPRKHPESPRKHPPDISISLLHVCALKLINWWQNSLKFNKHQTDFSAYIFLTKVPFIRSKIYVPKSSSTSHAFGTNSLTN